MTYKSKKKILITTAIDYCNDVIHIGHAYQKLLADCVARFEKLRRGGDNVYFLTGTDEHGSKNETTAKKQNLSPQELVDKISELDKAEIKSLNIEYSRFIRTTEADHKRIATEFYAKSLANKDIYEGVYQGFYCEGCESNKTLSELTEDKKCPLHQKLSIQTLDEKNYFFRLSKYSDFILELLEKDRFVMPEGRKAEMIAFVKNGLKDVTVTRPKEKVSWGIQAPNDRDQVLYVWFDALINYYTAGSEVGFWDEDTEVVHFLGKDNGRWHATLWPAMLKSAGLKLPDTVYIHGFANLNGQKISKSLGNVIKTSEAAEKYTPDGFRYYYLRYGPNIEDVNVTHEHIVEVYNGELANGLGNTVSRVAKLAEKSGLEFPIEENQPNFIEQEWFKPFENYRIDLVIQNLWKKISEIDKHINEYQPWLISDKEKLKKVIGYEVTELRKLAVWLEPIIPQTSEKIKKAFANPKIHGIEPLFPRLN